MNSGHAHPRPFSEFRMAEDVHPTAPLQRYPITTAPGGARGVGGAVRTPLDCAVIQRRYTPSAQARALQAPPAFVAGPSFRPTPPLSPPLPVASQGEPTSSQARAYSIAGESLQHRLDGLEDRVQLRVRLALAVPLGQLAVDERAVRLHLERPRRARRRRRGDGDFGVELVLEERSERCGVLGVASAASVFDVNGQGGSGGGHGCAGGRFWSGTRPRG
eukprot:CAMPEP_0184390442 /NCGR_PEP_ID=MMETSP0007-20130409/13307_1 /TAXON_ID=97485 /ORGANISM="Prymnesium parvum, Strain Texoma1" /LENGTH=217 /DNA_ID=CAMNT_0026740183 /DNA_START=94 /DNA_END=744 /DNA_ORIENTATION=-